MDALIKKIIEKQSVAVVGIDTDFDYLPDSLKEGVTDFQQAAKAIEKFNFDIIDAVADIVPAVKIQIAYYEMYGVEGIKTFERTAKYAAQKGLYVILDAKRNDIGSTAECYAKAFLGKTPVNGEEKEVFCGDSLTVNGYLGSDGLKPFIKYCGKGKSIFSLVKTSNPSGGEFQDMELSDGRKVYEAMGDLVNELGKDLIGEYGYSSVGAVVGATHPAQAENLRKRLPSVVFLIPGYGAQGGTAKDILPCFDSKGLGGIVNSSRGIICAYKNKKYLGLSYAEAARKAAADMNEEIKSAFAASGIEKIG